MKIHNVFIAVLGPELQYYYQYYLCLHPPKKSSLIEACGCKL